MINEGINTSVRYRQNAQFWFRRKVDESSFCVKGEKEASIIYYRRDFRDKFTYLGWSDGTSFSKSISQSGLKRLTGDEHRELIKQDVGLDAPRTAAVHAAEEAELQAALANPDKSPPRNISIETINGDPVIGGVVADTIRMMGR